MRDTIYSNGFFKEYDKRGFVAAYLDKSKAIKWADKRKSFYLSTWAEIEERNS